MYRVVVLVLFITSSFADDDLAKRACYEFDLEERDCCKKIPVVLPMRPETEMIHKNCFEETKGSRPKFSNSSCVIQECLAKKLGYYGADGKIDIDAFTSYIEEELKNDPEYFSAIKKKCLNTDISKYGPSDSCDFAKMDMCFFTLIFAVKCPEWSDEGKCKGMKDIMEDCKTE